MSVVKEVKEILTGAQPERKRRSDRRPENRAMLAQASGPSFLSERVRESRAERAVCEGRTPGCGCVCVCVCVCVCEDKTEYQKSTQFEGSEVLRAFSILIIAQKPGATL